MRKYIFMASALLFVLAACNSHSGHEADGHDHQSEVHNHGEEDHSGHSEAEERHAHAEAHDHTAKGNEIVLSPEKAKAAGVEARIIEREDFCQVIRTGGQVTAAQGDERVAVAPVSGVVSFTHQVTEGMRVAEGAPLLVLSSDKIAEGDPVEKARVEYEVSKQEYERMQKLSESRIVSEKELARAKQAYENARIAYEAIAKGEIPGGLQVMSPMAGYVKNLLVKEGDYVSVGQPLVTITRNRKLFLRADVAERHYAELPRIADANFCTTYNNKVYSVSGLGGRLLSYGKAAGDASGYVPVTFELENRDDIVPGSFVEVYLLGEPIKDVITLPREALTEEQGNFYVYRQLDEECYEKQPVTTGGSDGAKVLVLSGVKEGDRIVTRGAYQVKLASASNAIPAHTHEH